MSEAIQPKPLSIEELDGVSGGVGHPTTSVPGSDAVLGHSAGGVSMTGASANPNSGILGGGTPETDGAQQPVSIDQSHPIQREHRTSPDAGLYASIKPEHAMRTNPKK